jgi:hypothetical protein
MEELLAGAARATGTTVELLDDLSFSNRATVARVRLGDGHTAIAKRPFEAETFAREVEAFRLIPPSARPAFMGSADGVFVMEDLGSGPSLADVLLGDDGAAAERALLAWAGSLGTAVGATMRRGAPTGRIPVASGVEAFIGLAGDLDVSVPAGLDEDVGRIEDTMAAASPWLAYCPGDTCPDNNRVLGDGTVRFFDFEGSGWRHASTEAAYCRAPFCTCWCVAWLPEGTTVAMEDAFLQACQPPQPDEFRAATGLAAVWWTLRTADLFCGFVSGGWSARMRAIAPIDARQYFVLRLAAIEAEAARIPALAALAHRLREAIVERWAEAAVAPAYPAFRTTMYEPPGRRDQYP